MDKGLVLLLTAVLGYSNQALATKFKGATTHQATKAIILTESVDRFIETEKEFLILLSRHAAFYHFPKTAESTTEVRLYLKKLIKSKKTIVFEIDPVSTEIRFIKDN